MLILILILPALVWVFNYHFNVILNYKINSEYWEAKQADDSRLEKLKDQFRTKYGIRYGTDMSITEIVTALYIQDTVRDKARIGNMTLVLVLLFVVYLFCMYGFYYLADTHKEQIEWDSTSHRPQGFLPPTSPDDDFYGIWGIGMFLGFVPLALFYVVNVFMTFMVRGIDSLRNDRNCNLTSESYFLIDEFISINQEDEDQINSFMQTLKERKLSTAYQYAQKELNRIKS